MTHNSLEDLLEAAGDPVELLRNSPAGPNVYPGVPAGVHELARRAAGVAARPASCSTSVTTWPTWPWRAPTRSGVALAARRQQLRGVRGGSREALRALQPRRLRDRRRDPVRARGEPVQPRRPRARPELGHVPRRDRRVRRRGRARPADGAAHRRAPQVLPIPGAGAERDAGDRAGARPAASGAEVLPHDDGRHRRARPCARSATAWWASPAGSCSGRGTTASASATR